MDFPIDRESQLADIRAIQLDAYKAGMRGAAEIAIKGVDLPEEEIPHASIKGEPTYYIGIRRGYTNAANAILTAAENLKELP